jgi:hypothetical protein
LRAGFDYFAYRGLFISAIAAQNATESSRAFSLAAELSNL